MARHSPHLLSLEELNSGDEWESPRRTVTETDVVLFAGLSGDLNPIHCDHAAAADGPFRRPVAHGLLGLAIGTGLASTSPRVDTLAFLAILEWRFLLPIEFGDTIHIVTEVESIHPQARGRRGIVTWHRRIINQRGQVVQEGRTQTLVRSGTLRQAAPPELTESP